MTGILDSLLITLYLHKARREGEGGERERAAI